MSTFVKTISVARENGTVAGTAVFDDVIVVAFDTAETVTHLEKFPATRADLLLTDTKVRISKEAKDERGFSFDNVLSVTIKGSDGEWVMIDRHVIDIDPHDDAAIAEQFKAFYLYIDTVISLGVVEVAVVMNTGKVCGSGIYTKKEDGAIVIRTFDADGNEQRGIRTTPTSITLINVLAEEADASA